MPIDGQKKITEYRGFKVTLQYFREDPYREDPEIKKKRKKDAMGWSFGVYGVVDRIIHYYTAWSHTVFYGENEDKAAFYATDMIDAILNRKHIPEVSTLKLPERKIDG